MQQDNNIENKLRELDDQQQPDLSAMNDHWLQMQAMLQPGTMPAKKGLPKWMLNSFYAAIVALLLIGAYYFLNKENNITPQAAVPNTVPVVVNKNDTTVVKESVDSTPKVEVVESPVPDLRIADMGKDKGGDYKDFLPSGVDSLKIRDKSDSACRCEKKDSIAATINRKLLLQNLFTQIEKETQQFTIDNSKDTLLQAAEGTAVLIPANSLGGKSGIEFIIREFYKESDIILNQLSTMSNKDQLVTGGMVQLTATLNGKELAIDPAKPIRLFLTDTSSEMRLMQLFEGVKNGEAPNAAITKIRKELSQDTMANYTTGNINWLPQRQQFARKRTVNEVRVLNIIDQPFKTKEKRKGKIGYFIMDDESIAMDKEKLRQLLKEKYGYYKVKFRSSIRNWFSSRNSNEFNNKYATNIGDSMWMDKQLADRYKLQSTATRQYEQTANNVFEGGISSGTIYYKLSRQSGNLFDSLQNKYSINISKFGWINCDRFYNDPRPKVQYAVNLGDSAKNYYTVLLFEKVKSMIGGFVDGNIVQFNNLPKGEKVTIVSIGIDKMGRAVYTAQPAIINNQGVTDLQFQTTSATALKASLSKMNK